MQLKSDVSPLLKKNKVALSEEIFVLYLQRKIATQKQERHK
jgi:hypothetical protein